jgi:hypothetical protein
MRQKFPYTHTSKFQYDFVGCRYMKRQPLVELFYNVYYSGIVYIDELEFEELKNNSELCNTLNVVLKCNTKLEL